MTVTPEINKERIEQVKNDIEELKKYISKIEDKVDMIHQLTLTVERISINFENYIDNLTDINERVKQIESKDGETWRKFVWTIVSTLVGIIIGFLWNYIVK